MNQLNIKFIVESINNNKINDKIKDDKSELVNEKLDLSLLECYNSKNFKKFNNIFSNHIDRIGIHNYFKNYNSTYYCILFTIDNDFKLYDIKDQKNYINFLKVKLLQDYNIKLNKIENLNYIKLKDILNNKNNNKNYEQLFV